MSRRYAFLFSCFSLAWILAIPSFWQVIGWWAILLLYPATSFGLLAIAYASIGPRLLGKRANGQRSILGWILFLPYFWVNHRLFDLIRLTSREPAWVEVIPNLWLGRRLTVHECEQRSWVAVIDVAVEFTEIRPLRNLEGYHSLPILDATAPTAEQISAAIIRINDAINRGPIYVHCALGHGRSACMVIAYLLSISRVSTIAEGEQLLQSLRPSVRLNRVQRGRLNAYEESLKKTGDGK